jgi:hypothetical protein
MGFCSGTEIFDPIAGYVLKSDLTDTQKRGVLMALIEALYAHDWDCESDSRYWHNPLIREVFKQYPVSWDDEG